MQDADTIPRPPPSVDAEISALRNRKAELEAELQNNSLMSHAVDASSESIIIADINRPDQPIIYVNEAFLRMTGYSRGEVYLYYNYRGLISC